MIVISSDLANFLASFAIVKVRLTGSVRCWITVAVAAVAAFNIKQPLMLLLLLIPLISFTRSTTASSLSTFLTLPSLRSD